MDQGQVFRFLVALADELLVDARKTLQAGEEAQTTDCLRDIETILQASHVVDISGSEVELALKRVNQT